MTGRGVDQVLQVELMPVGTPVTSASESEPVASKTLRELDAVRVVALRGTGAEHLCVSRAQRPPRLGDVGSVVQVLGSTDQPRYLVESVTGEGETIWLAELDADELQLESEFERRKAH